MNAQGEEDKPVAAGIKSQLGRKCSPDISGDVWNKNMEE